MMQPTLAADRRSDPLADLCEHVIAEGIALKVDPENLLRATAEAFDFLFARSSGIVRS